MMAAIIQRCKSCHAEIYWLRNAATGKRAPINATPDPKGNIAVDLSAATYEVVAPKDLWTVHAAGRPLMLNHFATCPQAKGWKR